MLLPALILGAAFGAFRVVRLVGWRGKGWLATYAALGLLGALSLITEWRHGGLVTLGAWMALLVGPALANVQLRRSTERGDHGRALFWSRVGSILHPLDGAREVHAILRAVRLADAGDSDEWQDILRKIEASKSPVAVNARLQRLQLTGQWSELRAWLEGLDPKIRDGNSALVTNWVRAAGEQGEPEVMLQRYAHAIALPGVHQVRPILETVQLETAAFTGQLETVERVMRNTHLSAELQAMWRAMALASSGRADRSQALLHDLTRSPRALVRRAAERRLARLPPAVEPTQLSDGARAILTELQATVRESEQVGHLVRPARRETPATWALLALLTAVYLAQVLLHATDDPDAFVLLGAVVTPIGHPDFAWWRILTASWLHVGTLHVSANLLGLYLFGRFVEASLSSGRAVVIFLAGGVLAMLFAVLVMTWTRDRPELLVGASGSVMALVGAGVWTLWASWRRLPGPQTRARALEVAMIVAFQAVVDMVTPQVSFLAHLGGAVAGFGLAAALNRWA